MKLQTQIPLEPSKTPLAYETKVLLLGSCFVENIGQKLEYFKFQSVQNPFGILFHPMAIENLVVRSLENRHYEEKEVFEHDGIWHSYDAHSGLSAPSKQELLDNLNGGLEETANLLKDASHIVITLGTSWVYRHVESQKIVANCHKVPQKEFLKELLSLETIEATLSKMVQAIRSVNKKAQLIFTVSPVRHLKDGFVENQRSKANLIAALHSFMERSDDKTSYFPSYEIMMDELRDYRFYGKDMVHPNELAVDYIWERFKSVWISAASLAVMDEVEQVQKGLRHRPFNPESEAHRKFKKSLSEKITYLQEKYPFMKF